MNTLYTVTFSNGYCVTFAACSIGAAKAKCTRLATFGAGSYSLQIPNGQTWRREFWQTLRRFGWYKWQLVDCIGAQ